MNVGQTKQFVKVGTKKRKTQNNLATSRSQMCMGVTPPYPRITLHQMPTTLMSRESSLDVWNKNSDWTDWCRTLL